MLGDARPGQIGQMLDHPLVRPLLEGGALGHVGVTTGRGPHVTPQLYGVGGGHLWLVTPRLSLKARSLRQSEEISVMVGFGDSSLIVQGAAAVVDPLRPPPASVLGRGSGAAEGLLSYVRRNAGDAVSAAADAARHPRRLGESLRASIAVRVHRLIVVRESVVVHEAGDWPAAEPVGRCEEATGGVAPRELPPDLAGVAAEPGTVAIGLETVHGSVVLPGRWDPRRGTVHLAAAALDRTGAVRCGRGCVSFGATGREASEPRCGLLLRGTFVPMSDGRETALALRTERVTSWRGETVETVEL